LTRKGKLAYRMHNKYHTLLVDRIVSPLDEDQRQVLLNTLTGIYDFVSSQYRRYTSQNEEGEHTSHEE
jgi:hypothetical protein